MGCQCTLHSADIAAQKSATATEAAAKSIKTANAAQKAANAAQKASVDAAAKVTTATTAATNANTEWQARVAGTASNESVANQTNIVFDQVSAWEGHSFPEGYIPWPASGGASGVTVGPGLDLGQQTPESLRNMGLSEPLVQKLSPYCTDPQTKKPLRKQAACDFLAKNPLKLTPDELKEVDEKMEAAYAKTAIDRWNKNNSEHPFKDLDTKFQTVLLSRSINSATATSGSAMSDFNTAVIAGNKEDAAKALEAIAGGLTEKQIGLASRLNLEVGYLRKP